MRRMYSNTELANLLKQIADGEISKLFEEDGKKYKIVGCVLRNVDGTWQQIGGGDHAPINVDSISQSGLDIIVNFKFEAKNVVSFVACPDEDFAKLGYFIGSSVGLDKAHIEVFQRKPLGGYYQWNSGSSAFQCYEDITNVTIEASGKMTITHTDCGADCFGRNIQDRNGKYLIEIDSIGATEDKIFLKDLDGNRVTTPGSDFKLFWTASETTYKYIRAEDVNQQGNIWCLGIFEVE